MKPVISITLISIFVTLASCSKTEPLLNEPALKGCTISTAVDTAYRQDAKVMIFRNILMDSTHADRNNPNLNTAEIDALLQKINAVHRLSIPARDSVFNKYHIHTHPVGLRQMHFQVDTTAPEIQNFIAGQPTGDSIFDQLIQQYQINTVRTALSYPSFNWLYVSTSVDLNLIPVAEEVEQLPYIYLAEYGGYAIGDGNNITYTEKNGITELDFSIGWGDCPAGCIYHKHWVFEVDEECTASLVKVFED